MEGKSGLTIFGMMVFGAGIFAVFTVLATMRVNEHEQILYCIILTLLSVAMGFMFSLQGSGHRLNKATEELKLRQAEDLKTRAVKTADNIDALSREFQRFARFLEGELQNQYKDAGEGYRSRTERIESSIHIINTLRSMNEASLNDWRNVIPERVVEKPEAREEIKYPTPAPSRPAEPLAARPAAEAPRPPLKPTGGAA